MTLNMLYKFQNGLFKVDMYINFCVLMR